MENPEYDFYFKVQGYADKVYRYVGKEALGHVSSESVSFYVTPEEASALILEGLWIVQSKNVSENDKVIETSYPTDLEEKERKKGIQMENFQELYWFPGNELTLPPASREVNKLNLSEDKKYYQEAGESTPIAQIKKWLLDGHGIPCDIYGMQYPKVFQVRLLEFIDSLLENSKFDKEPENLPEEFFVQSLKEESIPNIKQQKTKMTLPSMFYFKTIFVETCTVHKADRVENTSTWLISNKSCNVKTPYELHKIEEYLQRKTWRLCKEDGSPLEEDEETSVTSLNALNEETQQDAENNLVKYIQNAIDQTDGKMYVSIEQGCFVVGHNMFDVSEIGDGRVKTVAHLMEVIDAIVVIHKHFLRDSVEKVEKC